MTRIPLAAVLFVAAIGACHFDDSFQIDAKVDPGRPGAEHREACTERAAGSCSYAARCYAYYFDRAWRDLATCVDRTMLACQLEASDPRSNRDDDSIRACTVPADFPCSSDPTYDAALAEYREMCPEPVGELQNGSDCGSHAECASGYCIRDSAAQPCATCRPDPCASCAEGLRCVAQGGSSVICMNIVEDGGSCLQHLDCASLYCKSFVCASPPKEDEPCEPDGPGCDGDGQVNLFCNASTLRCERVSLLEAGDTCQAMSSAAECGGGTTCLPHAATSTCVEPAADGAPCFASQGLGCLPPASCVDGFCRFFHAQDSCSPD